MKSTSEQLHDTSQRDVAAPRDRRRAVWARLLLALFVFAALSPLIRHDFGGFDDDMNVARNPHLNPPTWQGLLHYWKQPEFDLYVPVTYTVWWAAAHVAWLPEPDAFGRRLNPYVFHLLNLALHTLAAIAAFEVLRHCVRGVWPALAGALLFGLHPLQVEAVGWVAGMKDVLAGMLALLALWQYLRAGEIGTAWKRRVVYSIGTIAFGLAMLSKPSAVVLPAIALVIDWLVIRRSLHTSALRAMPWFLLAIPCIIWTRLAQPAPFIGEAIAFHYRPLIATDALAFYLYKLVWPLRLAVDYGRTPQLVIERGWIWFTWILPLVLAVGAWRVRRTAPALTAALLIFIIGLSPVLGIVPFDFQAYSTVADHYVYLAMFGPALAAAWVASRRPTSVALPLALLVIAFLTILSILQTRHWRDTRTIFQQALRVNPVSWVSHTRLADHWADHGDFERALLHSRLAAQANDRAWPAFRAIGENLARLGRIDEAIDAYRTALALQPEDVPSNINLANLLADRGQYDGAIAHYRAALQHRPHSVLIHTNLALTYEEMGHLEQAAEHYQRALQINPGAPAAQSGLLRVRAAQPPSG